MLRVTTVFMMGCVLAILASSVAFARQVEVESVYGSWKGLYFAVRWSDGNSAACEVSQAGPGETRSWQKAPGATCDAVSGFFRDHQDELVKEQPPLGPPSKDRNGHSVPDVPLLYGPHTARIHSDQLFLVGDLSPTGSCDMDNPKNCEKPTLSISTQLSEEVRRATAKILGPLPFVPLRD